MGILGIVIQNPASLKYLYITELIVSALFLITLGLEDNKTLKVSWMNTGLYVLICIPGLIAGIHSGILQSQLIYYIAGAVFAGILIIYSFWTGRGGADRDIGIISILAYPMLAVLSLIPALLISVIATARTKKKFPMLFPYSIIFGCLALVQLIVLF